MFSKKIDRNSKEWRRLVAWLVGTIVMPIAAYPLVSDSVPISTFDIPVIFIMGSCWGLVSFLLYLFIKKKMH